MRCFRTIRSTLAPYSPASRLLLNVLNIDVTAVPELRESAEARRLFESEPFREQLESCRDQSLLDYAGVAALKLAVLEKLFETCRTGSDRTRWQAFERFQREQGEMLRRNCLFLA